MVCKIPESIFYTHRVVGGYRIGSNYLHFVKPVVSLCFNCYSLHFTAKINRATNTLIRK